MGAQRRRCAPTRPSARLSGVPRDVGAPGVVRREQRAAGDRAARGRRCVHPEARRGPDDARTAVHAATASRPRQRQAPPLAGSSRRVDLVDVPAEELRDQFHHHHEHQIGTLVADPQRAPRPAAGRRRSPGWSMSAQPVAEEPAERDAAVDDDVRRRTRRVGAVRRHVLDRELQRRDLRSPSAPRAPRPRPGPGRRTPRRGCGAAARRSAPAARAARDRADRAGAAADGRAARTAGLTHSCIIPRTARDTSAAVAAQSRAGARGDMVPGVGVRHVRRCTRTGCSPTRCRDADLRLCRPDRGRRPARQLTPSRTPTTCARSTRVRLTVPRGWEVLRHEGEFPVADPARRRPRGAGRRRPRSRAHRARPAPPTATRTPAGAATCAWSRPPTELGVR